MSRILAFDYGARRTGIAITDSLQLIATSLETVETKNLFDFLKKYFLKEKVEVLVIGYPFNHGHKENDVTRMVDAFILELEKQFPDKKTEKIDERFSSRMASRTIAMSGLKKASAKKKGILIK